MRRCRRRIRGWPTSPLASVAGHLSRGLCLLDGSRTVCFRVDADHILRVELAGLCFTGECLVGIELVGPVAAVLAAHLRLEGRLGLTHLAQPAHRDGVPGGEVELGVVHDEPHQRGVLDQLQQELRGQGVGVGLVVLVGGEGTVVGSHGLDVGAMHLVDPGVGELADARHHDVALADEPVVERRIAEQPTVAVDVLLEPVDLRVGRILDAPAGHVQLVDVFVDLLELHLHHHQSREGLDESEVDDHGLLEVMRCTTHLSGVEALQERTHSSVVVGATKH